jgi:hypothetical protein
MQAIPLPYLPSKHEPGQRARPVVAIRLLEVPQTAPAYDDERDSPPPGASSASGGNAGCSATAAAALPAAGRASQSQPWQLSTDQLRPRQAGPEQDGWPRQFAQVLAETLAGARPAHQLTQWTTEHARRRLRQLGPTLATGQRPRVRRVMTMSPARDVLELTAVVAFGPQVRVLALRLERDRAKASRPGGGWCCTTIETA